MPVELGDEISLATNFKAIALGESILRSPELGRSGIKAIIDIVPSLTTVLIQYDPQQRLQPFRDSLFLFQIGDRVKFRPICEEEFEAIESQVEEGRYEYEISAPQSFSLSNYLNDLQPSAA